jgi:hypothetical protein
MSTYHNREKSNIHGKIQQIEKLLNTGTEQHLPTVSLANFNIKLNIESTASVIEKPLSKI